MMQRPLAILALALAPHTAPAQTSAMTTGIDAVGATEAGTADHVAIEELTHLFENTFDAGDIDAHMATWADEITFQSPFGDHDDREGYRRWVSGFSEQTRGMGGTRHLITNSVIALDGDEARQTAYLVIVGRTLADGAPALMATAQFDDELVRTADGWRFRARTLTVDQDPAAFQAD